jgi:hypothetical protein
MQNNAVQEAFSIQPLWLTKFVECYQELSTDNLDLLASIYHEEVTFIDPIHQVEGFNNLYDYFKNVYENLSQCDFVINNIIVNENEAAIYWNMTYVHSKLNHGKEVTVAGSSHIKGHDGKVIYHRDYLDVGAMLYEQIPLLGRLIKWMKSKAAS